MNVRRRRPRRPEEGGATSGNRQVLLMVVGAGLLAFLIGYGITALAFTSGAAPADVVLVPDVRRQTLAEASRTLGEHDLTLVVGDSFPNPTVDAGAVLAQSPLPSQEVSPGTEVRVILSTGQRRPTVPAVEAMPLALATRALQAAGFDITIEEAPGEGVPGRVLSVDPAAGTPVPLPATVLIRVGAGMPLLDMPDVTGMQEDDAREILETAGLRVTEVLYETAEGMEAYQVINQDPAPGESAAQGSSVRLRVNLPQVIRTQGRAGPDGGTREDLSRAGERR